MMYIPFPKDDGYQAKLKLDLKMAETTGLVDQIAIGLFHTSYGVIIYMKPIHNSINNNPIILFSAWNNGHSKHLQ